MMIKPLHISLIILLVLLQLVSPLLHAHSGLDNSPNGIHLHNPDPLFSRDNGAFDDAIAQPADKLVQSKGIVVVVSTGMMHKVALSNYMQDVFLFKEEALYFTPLVVPDIKIFPQISGFFFHIYCRPNSPRAPPVNRTLT